MKSRSKTGELELFKEIWDEREHQSFLSGKPVQANIFCFAHVLSKGMYPKFRLNKENIILLTAEEHQLLDHGTEEKRIKYGYDWGKIWKLKEKLRRDYEEQT